MPRMVQSPRYPVGTKVLKYFNGYTDPFVGTVDYVSGHSGFYHILYDDGDSEEMTEDDVEKHYHAPPRGKKRAVNVLITSPDCGKQTQSNCISTKGKEKINVEDKGDEVPIDEVNKYVGQNICTANVDDAGNESILSGTVLSYFPATKMFRVLYLNGQLNDLSYQDVVDSIPLNSSPIERGKKKLKSSGDKVSYSDGVNQAPSASPKRPKAYNNKLKLDHGVESMLTSDSHSPSVSSSSLQIDADSSREYILNQDGAYNIVRQTLYIITNNVGVTCPKKDIQIKILQKESYKPKDALEKFVEHDGLNSLNELLSLWVLSKDTEPGVLLILKVLAVIPGVTSTAVLKSRIGKKLHLIDKCKIEGMTDPDSSMSVMARWIIKKWKSQLDIKPTPKARDNVKGDVTVKKDEVYANATVSDGTQAKTRTISDPKRTTASTLGIKPTSNSVHYLRDLMSGSRPAVPSRSTSSGLSAIANSTGSLRQLGSQQHRPRRSTVLLDAITNRKAKNEEAAAAEKTKAANASKESITLTKISFGDVIKVMKVEFDKEQEVSRLLEHRKKSPFKYDPLRMPLKSILLRYTRYPDCDEKVPDESTVNTFSLQGSTSISIVETGDAIDLTESFANIDDDSSAPPPPPPSPPRPREKAMDDLDMAVEVVVDNSSSPLNSETDEKEQLDPAVETHNNMQLQNEKESEMPPASPTCPPSTESNVVTLLQKIEILTSSPESTPVSSQNVFSQAQSLLSDTNVSIALTETQLSPEEGEINDSR